MIFWGRDVRADGVHRGRCRRQSYVYNRTWIFMAVVDRYEVYFLDRGVSLIIGVIRDALMVRRESQR